MILFSASCELAKITGTSFGWCFASFVVEEALKRWGDDLVLVYSRSREVVDIIPNVV